MENLTPVLPRSTFQKHRIQKTEVGRQKSENRFLFSVFCLLFSVSCLLTGCGPKYTYPANSVPKSIEDIDRKEYKIESTARVVGKTVGVLCYVDSITDAKGQIPKDFFETMGKAMGVIVRVSLASDLPVDFCTVIMRDRKNSNELVITRSLDDVRRVEAYVISLEEASNRQVISQGKPNPEIENSGNFVLKEVKLPNFLADQIVQRIRFSFSKEPRQEEIPHNTILVDGLFDNEPSERSFRFSMISIKTEDPKKIILSIFKIINDVLKSYSFNEFDKIEVQDYLNRKKLVVNRQMILDYQQKKITEAQVLEKCLVESQSIQEAFKLFGFSPPQEAAEKDAAVPRPATP